jgi:putative nucleotidyltransferase with HDIG domain
MDEFSEFSTPERKLEALNQVANLLRKVGDIEDFSKMLVATVANALGVSACTFLLREGQQNFRRLAGIGSEISSELFLKEENDIAKRVSINREIVTDEVEVEMTKGGVGRKVFYLGIPVNFRDEVGGVLFIRALHRLGLEDNDFLRLIVTQVGLAIEKNKTYEEMKLESAKFFSFVEIGKALASIHDIDELLNCITHTALQLVQGETASLMLVAEDEKDYLTIRAASGVDKDIVKKSKIKIGEGIAGWVAETGTPLLLTDISEDPRFKNLPRKSRQIRSAVVVPLEWNKKIIGVLNVDNVTSDYQFSPEDLRLLSILAGQAGLAIENARAYTEARKIYIGTIRALAFTVEAKDKYSIGHFDRVTRYSVSTAKKLGLSKEAIEAIRYAAILHDIGKIDISEEILLKPDVLTKEERELINMHPKLGAQIIEPVSLLSDVSEIIYHHHERYDGKGYLDGLKGEQIPLGSRILAVADTYEALISDRSYKKALTEGQAKLEIERCAGSQFDPEVVKAFLAVLEEESENTRELEESALMRGE